MLGVAELPYCPQLGCDRTLSLPGNRGMVAGQRKAKASGKRIGRPKTVLNRRRIEQLRQEGLSWREIARKMDLPKSTVYRYRRLAQNPRAPGNS